MPDNRFFINKGPFSLAEILSASGALTDFTQDKAFDDVAPLQTATASQISFLDNPKYLESFKNTQAGACFVKPEYAKHAPDHTIPLVTESPHLAYAKTAQLFYLDTQQAAHISEYARIAETARIDTGANIQAGAIIGENTLIGQNCQITANAVIGDNVVVGNNCKIGANASLSHCIIGNNVVIYPGARIGQPGFGFAPDKQGVVKVPQLGRVIIGHNVEVGANSTVDRGAGPDTIIGDFTMIDNLVQIGHNVQIGVGCIIAGMVGIAGSTIIDDFVQIGGKAGIAGHLSIGKGAKIAASSGVMKDIAHGEAVGGAPAQPIRQWMKQIAYLKKMTKN